MVWQVKKEPWAWGGIYSVVHLKTLFIKKNINQKHLKNTEGERECINM